MRINALSVRDNDSIYSAAMVKEAEAIGDFISGMANTIGGKLQLKTKPFETIFSLASPLVFGSSWIGKALWALAENFGVGPGTFIGKWLDEALGFGDPNNVPNLTEEKLESTAEELAKKLLSSEERLSLKSEDHHQITKQAKISIIGYAARLIYKAILGASIALGVAGIVGGLTGAVMGPKSTERISDTSTGDSSIPSHLQQYSNVNNDVERSIITYIDTMVDKIKHQDGSVLNFSETFHKLHGYMLLGSPEMAKVLNVVREINHYKTLEEISEKKKFFGPKAITIVRALMPEAKHKYVDEPVSVDPKSIKQKVMPKTKVDPKIELKQILKGVMR